MGDPASDCERDTVEGWSTEIGGGIEGVGIGLGTVGSSGGGPIGCLQKATALKASSASSELLSSIAPEATVHAAWPSASAATSAIVSAPKPRSTPPFCALLLRSPLPADNSSDPSDPRKSFKIVQASRAVALARRTARCALPSSPLDCKFTACGDSMAFGACGVMGVGGAGLGCSSTMHLACVPSAGEL